MPSPRWRLTLLGLLALGAAPSCSLLLGAGRAPVASPSAGAPALGHSSRFATRTAVAVRMQEGDPGEGERQRGRTITVARPKPKPKQDRKEDVDKEPSWRVLLHNDDVRTLSATALAATARRGAQRVASLPVRADPLAHPLSGAHL